MPPPHLLPPQLPALPPQDMPAALSDLLSLCLQLFIDPSLPPSHCQPWSLGGVSPPLITPGDPVPDPLEPP